MLNDPQNFRLSFKLAIFVIGHVAEILATNRSVLQEDFFFLSPGFRSLTVITKLPHVSLIHQKFKKPCLAEGQIY